MPSADLAIASVSETPSAVPYFALIGMFAVTLAVGLAASLRPAGRAASVPPVRALSEE